jgi:hypothetical protein
MKKLSLYIVLVLMWSNVSFANDITKIEDIKINGVSIGDNLLDHFSKLELIQNKKLLEVRSEQNQLFYSSEVKIPFFSLKAIFYYESNERVGMTEKPIYRIIGISMPVEICDAGLWDSDEIIEEVNHCNEKDEINKIYKLFDNNYFQKEINWKQSKNDYLRKTKHRPTNYDVIKVFKNDGCYYENATIGYDLTKKGNQFLFLGGYVNLYSQELDKILFVKNC